MWLIASLWALGSYGSDSLRADAPVWNFLLCGLIVAAVGGAAYAFYHLWEDRADIELGGWLVTSPWLSNIRKASLLHGMPLSAAYCSSS